MTVIQWRLIRLHFNSFCSTQQHKALYKE